MSQDAPASSTISIQPMRPEDARAVAALHARGINKGFLVKLGRRFLRELYLGIAQDPDSSVFVALASGRVVGFCAYAGNVAGLYKRVLKARWFRLGLASLPNSLNPWLVKEVFDTLRYPGKQSAAKLPPAEILSIAVDESMRGAGVGKILLRHALDQARRDGQHEIKVLAGAHLDGANRFYQQCGFENRAQIIQHGEPLNVYVRQTDAPAKG